MAHIALIDGFDFMIENISEAGHTASFVPVGHHTMRSPSETFLASVVDLCYDFHKRELNEVTAPVDYIVIGHYMGAGRKIVEALTKHPAWDPKQVVIIQGGVWPEEEKGPYEKLGVSHFTERVEIEDWLEQAANLQDAT